MSDHTDNLPTGTRYAEYKSIFKRKLLQISMRKRTYWHEGPDRRSRARFRSAQKAYTTKISHRITQNTNDVIVLLRRGTRKHSEKVEQWWIDEECSEAANLIKR